MKEVFENLSEIVEWIDKSPDPSGFKNNDDFMNYTVELMSHTLYLLRVGASLAPTQESSKKGFSKRKAIVAGHMVRIAKLYEGLAIHVSKRQLELASIFTRLVFETAIKMEYLMKSKKETFRSFVLTSYKPEREMLQDLNQKAATRPLIKIERRMRRNMMTRLKRDGISFKELMSNKTWKLDGKDFRRILDDLDRGESYSYLFGNGSHAIHGDWQDISLHHIKKRGRYYLPRPYYRDPDPRIACALTSLCLDALYDYIRWTKTDPDLLVSPIVLKLAELNRAVDTAHENTLET